MVSKKFKPMFDLWRETVDGLGYASFAQKLNSKNYNVPQNRDRIFLFSVHKAKNGGDVGYNFPPPMPLERRLDGILEDRAATKYYLNPVKVQEFVVNNLERIVEFAKNEVANGGVIEKMPDDVRAFVEGYK